MAQKTRRRRKQRYDRALVLKLIVIVALVIFVFEGRLIYTMVTYNSGKMVFQSDETVEQETGAEGEEAQTEASKTVTDSSMYLAGLSDAGLANDPDESIQETEAAHATVSDPDSTAIVREQETSVDDSYFSDAVFIGDSRMEGFRNTSGITEGTFFTSVGMSLSSMTSDEIISNGDDKITVAAALSGGEYKKIYIMLGANDLGEYDWDEFKSGFISVTERFLEIQPDAILYICSCIYVEEDKVTTGDYINNENVDTLNSILLEVCEEENYYYLDLNEVLSDGYGSLIEDASSDGVHITAEYCKTMLNYLRSHYVDDAGSEKEE